jgi:hypothetical protein
VIYDNSSDFPSNSLCFAFNDLLSIDYHNYSLTIVHNVLPLVAEVNKEEAIRKFDAANAMFAELTKIDVAEKMEKLG